MSTPSTTFDSGAVSSRTATFAVGAWAIVTVGAQLGGLSNLGAILSLVLLGGLVGCPLAIQLAPRRRSTVVVGAVSVALSLSMSALISQGLFWFGLTGEVLLVAATSAYGIVIAELLSQTTDTEQGAA